MNVKNYSTGADIGIATSIDEEKYEAYLAEDNSGTGAVKAGNASFPRRRCSSQAHC